MGIPGLEASHVWMGIPFCSMYIIALLGNSMILLTVRLDQTLHGPMYYFLCMLAVIDLVMATSIVPKMLGIFWLNSVEIAFDACFTQMFFVHSVTAAESGVLLAMAFDRYVAICYPLRYQAILTRQKVTQIGLAILLRAALFMTPVTWMMKRLPYCGSNVIAHSYCEHMAVVKLACADPQASSQYCVVGSTLIVGTDTAFISVSYGMILRAVLRLAEKEARLKAIGTCGSHLCVMLLYYVPGMASIYAQSFGQGVARQTQVLLADLYLTLPPMLNPVIYSMRTKQVQDAVLKVFRPKKDPV
ncbi:olfactory receptor 52I1-like [Mauremys mutica]|uniref:olfactory receptor 52I1-like n=1 Tax=Mauremys mutica TaxID=74926 RepID=UPI001D135AEE|nr:olfactory receptor 52I1-like [Mauremys mutica]